jgi:hypothetical protein
MDHAQFKARQTAATYVADDLDERTLEAFEMHMMGCAECVEDVETWRAIKLNMPRRARPARAPAILGRSTQAAMGWRMAASLVVGVALGVGGGWFGHESQVPNLDSTQTAFFNVPAATRAGGDCTARLHCPAARARHEIRVVACARRFAGPARHRHRCGETRARGIPLPVAVAA